VSRRPIESGVMAVRAGWNELLLHDPRRRRVRERDHVDRLARSVRPVDDQLERSAMEVGV
jgi:hypothetical protein